jgi:hypothetical protein
MLARAVPWVSLLTALNSLLFAVWGLQSSADPAPKVLVER